MSLPNLDKIYMKGLLVPKESTKEDFHLPQFLRVPPTVAPTGSIFTNNSSGEFIISKEVEEITGAVIVLTITNNHANAATNAVWTLSAKLADQTTDGTADGGVFCVGFPALRVRTTPQAYNVTAANLQIAIRALHPALAAVTVAGGTFATPAAYTITMVPTTDEYPLEDTEVEITGGVLDGAVICTLSAYMTTAYAVGGSLKLAPSPLLLKDVITYAETVQLESITGEHLWENLKTLSTSHEQKAIVRNIGYDFDTQKSLNWINGGGGSLTLFCPLTGPLFDQGQIVPSIHNKTKFRIVFTLQTGAVLKDSTSGSTATVANLQYSSCFLWLSYKQYPPEYIKEKQIEAASHIMGYQVWEARQDSIHDWSTVTAATEVSELIKIHGDISNIMFSLRLVNPTSAQSRIQSLKLDSIKLQDGHGHSIIGSDYVTHKVMRDIILPESYPWADHLIFDRFNTYAFTPSSDIRSAKYNGQVVGLYPIVGDERVYITPTASVGSPVQLYCFYNARRALLFYPDGHVEYVNQ